jgi:hypothetical protein
LYGKINKICIDDDDDDDDDDDSVIEVELIVFSLIYSIYILTRKIINLVHFFIFE